ncbi:MAG TPA: hypothetical protein VMZ03_05220 [Chitinophagaceae bacterium]|nr:hypothetical protein [Chitinophagaceae bacterium]
MKKFSTFLFILIPFIAAAQTAADIVVLESIGSGTNPNPRVFLSFKRIKSQDGMFDPPAGTFGYTAPAGKALVITETDWQFANGIAGDNVTLRIWLTWPQDPGTDRRVMESTITLGTSGSGGTSTAERTGILVPSGVKISVDVTGTGRGTGKIQHVLMRGYLIPG